MKNSPSLRFSTLTDPSLRPPGMASAPLDGKAGRRTKGSDLRILTDFDASRKPRTLTWEEEREEEEERLRGGAETAMSLYYYYPQCWA